MLLGKKEIMAQLIQPILWTIMFLTLFVTIVAQERTESYPISGDIDAYFAELIRASMENRVITDNKGIILYASPSAADITGYSQRELKGMQVEKLIPDRYMLRHREKMGIAIRRHDGKTVSTRCFLLQKDSDEVPVEIRTKVIPSKLGDLIVVGLTNLNNLIEDKL